jgi:tetratricopeptide (TPR) repeat protein
MENLERQLDQLIKEHANPYLFNEIGVFLYQMKDWMNARLYFQRAYKLDSENKDFLYNYASALYALSEWREALSIYQAYIALQPDAKEVQQKIGDLYYLIGEYEHAGEIYKQLHQYREEEA